MQAVQRVPSYEIRFQSLFAEGRALTFPCDASGQVLFEKLTDAARGKFMQAWDLVGREFAVPSVERSDCH